MAHQQWLADKDSKRVEQLQKTIANGAPRELPAVERLVWTRFLSEVQETYTAVAVARVAEGDVKARRGSVS